MVRNTVDELRQLVDSKQLTELRTTYNGSYGASLLFNTTTLQDYAALFHDKDFWRVIKTDSVDNAEKVYRTFVQQTEELAQVYIDTTRLEAGKRYTENLVAFNEQRLRSLQQEAELQRQQSLQVSASIEQAKQQAVRDTLSELRQSEAFRQHGVTPEHLEALIAKRCQQQLRQRQPLRGDIGKGHPRGAQLLQVFLPQDHGRYSRHSEM